jgi:hypothetical protein
MGNNKNSEEKKETNVREFLPFWARELLGMKDEVEKANKAEKSSSQEGSSLPHPASACP